MLRVDDIMTPHVVTLSSEATLRDAIDTLVSCRIGGAPVVERGAIVGVLSAPDILEFESVTPIELSLERPEDEASGEGGEEWSGGDESPTVFFNQLWPDDGSTASERFASTEGPEWDFLRDHTVGEAMSRAVCVVPAGLEVSAAAQRMLAAGAQRAIVVTSGLLAGILTTTDILRAVAERRLTTRQIVFR